MKSKNKKSSCGSKIKFLILCLSVFSFIALQAGNTYPNKLPLTQGGDWIKYFAKPGHIEIYFPVQYENNFQDTPEGKVTTVNAKNGDNEYLLIWTILKDNAPTGNDALIAAYKKFNITYKCQYIADVKEKFKNGKNEGAVYKLKSIDGSKDVDYRVIIVNKIQYELVVFSSTGKINEKDAKKFKKSFEITD